MGTATGAEAPEKSRRTGRHRVVQWATGQVGKACMRATIDHPQLELVGARVFDPAKVGLDVGTIAGREPIGVVATDQVDHVLGLQPGCVLYTPRAEPPVEEVVDDISMLLESGSNVVATGYMGLYGHDQHLWLKEPQREEHVNRIKAACESDGVTFHSTGIMPGFAMDVYPAVMVANCAEVTRVHCRQIIHYLHHESANTVVGLLDFGKDPQVKRSTIDKRWTMPEGSMRELARAMSVSLDDITLDYELLVAEEDVRIASTVIKKGTLAGYRRVHSGIVGGVPRIIFEHVHRATPALAPHWPGPDSDASLRYEVHIDGVRPMSSYMESGPARSGFPAPTLMTAYRAVNSVPAVCSAPPGMMSPLDLPPVSGVFSSTG